jgi:hypothetical protein
MTLSYVSSYEDDNYNFKLFIMYHYIFECSFPNVIDIRTKHIPSYYTRYPNFQKMIGLLSLCNVPVLKNLSLFISKI